MTEAIKRDPYFSGALDLRAYKKGEWVLLEPFRYHSKDGRTITVPKWFVTDLASIPWITMPLFDGAEHRAAGVIHDWLYCSQLYSRKEADQLFCEMVVHLGASPTQAGLMYAGLRVGGWSRWNQCTDGPKLEDFAFEHMGVRERAEYLSRYIGEGIKAQIPVAGG